MEDSLKAVYTIERSSDERVPTAALAEALEVAPSTVSSTLKTLDGRGLVDREAYNGVTLTAAGERVALRILRRHRLLETFLAERLEYDWAAVHEEADRLEHHVSAALTDRLADALGNPTVDPHGDPIPDADLSVPEEGNAIRLAEATAGERVTVRRIHTG